MWPGGAVGLYRPTCVGLCRTVVRAGDVRGEGLVGVVHMLGDQLLVGVLGGGDQLQQGIDVLNVSGAVRDGYAPTEGGFDAGPLPVSDCWRGQRASGSGRHPRQPAAAYWHRAPFGRIGIGGACGGVGYCPGGRCLTTASGTPAACSSGLGYPEHKAVVHGSGPRLATNVHAPCEFRHPFRRPAVELDWAGAPLKYRPLHERSRARRCRPWVLRCAPLLAPDSASAIRCCRSGIRFVAFAANNSSSSGGCGDVWIGSPLKPERRCPPTRPRDAPP